MASDMQQHESFERVYHGLRSAASCARKLSIIFRSNDYKALAAQIDTMALRAKELYELPALNHAEAIAILDRMVAKNMLAAGSESVQ